MPAKILLVVLLSAVQGAPAKPGCPESSPEEIGESYGVLWGPVSDRRGIGKEGSCAIMEGLVHYSAACGAPSPLPTDSWKRFHHCPSRKTVFGFLKFMTGQTKDPGACREYFRVVWTRFFRIFSESDFCATAARAADEGGGLGALCSELEKHLPPGISGPSSLCLSHFPRDGQDCGGKKECLDTLAAYRALLAGKPKACPEDYKPLCLDKTKEESAAAKRCEKARKQVEGLYCGLYDKAFKRTRGQIGMTDADLKRVEQSNREIKHRRR